MWFLLLHFKQLILLLTQLVMNLKYLWEKGGNKKNNLREPAYGQQVIFQIVVILKMSSMNCRIQVQVSSGALHIYGATLLITGIREGVEEIFTEAARCAATVPISTV